MIRRLGMKFISTKVGAKVYSIVKNIRSGRVFANKRKLRKAAPLVKKMAETGIGTDACLELGCLPMKVHFYSPVPDIKEIDKRGVFELRSNLSGIDFQPEHQLEMLSSLGRKFGDECSWPLERTGDEGVFYQKNNSFSFGCAATLHCMIRNFKPSRIFEIGSGNSSLIISSALEKNRIEGVSSDYSIIDPYPNAYISNGNLLGVNNLITKKVELSDIHRFETLQENDILFIDSGHTVKIGSDVNFLILEVLPLLQQGVIVHFHDINLPFAPPKTYYTNPAFRMFWTEEFLLQAFLCCNNDFEILLAMNWLQTEHMETFCSAFPGFDLANNWANSGSFWIRRKLA